MRLQGLKVTPAGAVHPRGSSHLSLCRFCGCSTSCQRSGCRACCLRSLPPGPPRSTSRSTPAPSAEHQCLHWGAGHAAAVRRDWDARAQGAGTQSDGIGYERKILFITASGQLQQGHASLASRHAGRAPSCRGGQQSVPGLLHLWETGGQGGGQGCSELFAGAGLPLLAQARLGGQVGHRAQVSGRAHCQQAATPPRRQPCAAPGQSRWH